jgi:hypothetical protein
VSRGGNSVLSHGRWRAIFHRPVWPAVIFQALSMAAGSAYACQCERLSTCNEVATANLVFIGTVESIEPMFLNRWNDSSQSSLRSLNDAFMRAEEHPSADALAKLKDAYLKTFPDASPDRRSQVQEAKTASKVATLFYSNVEHGMRVRFRVQALFKHQDDDDDDSPKPVDDSKNAKGKPKDDDDDDRKAAGGKKRPSPAGRAAAAQRPDKPEAKESEDFFAVWTPFGDCGVSFQTGETYLVYATDDEETTDSIVTDSCTRTRRLSDAGDDLAYLYFYKENPEESTRIDGFTTANPRYRLDFNPLHPERLAPPERSAVIELKSGPLTRFTETDPNGHFIFDGLPAGDYSLTAFDSDYPKGKQLSAEPQPFRLQPKSCSLQVLVLAPGTGPGEAAK